MSEATVQALLLFKKNFLFFVSVTIEPKLLNYSIDQTSIAILRTRSCLYGGEGYENRSIIPGTNKCFTVQLYANAFDIMFDL